MLRKVSWMGNVFLILGILCIVYYMGVAAYSGLGTSFVWIWLVVAAFFLGLWAICKVSPVQTLFYGIPGVIRILAGVLLGLGILVFLAAECCILSGMTASRTQPVDYVIVLGAQVRGTRVSQALKQRLDCAARYLQTHEEAIVIVSGGQGPGEDISEAEAMETYLWEAGISAERIWKEDQSGNTEQNIRYSRALIEDEDADIGIISNDFHVFRAVHIAKAQGVEAVGIPASSSVGMYPHFMMREALALVKDLLAGNAKL